LTVVVLTVVAMAFTAPAFACMTSCNCQGRICICTSQSGLVPGGQTHITMTAPDKAVISIGPYVTPRMTVTFACSVAFPVVPGINSIDRRRLGDTATGLPLSHYNWTTSDAAIGEVERLAAGDAKMADAAEVPWQGFFSEVVGGSEGGIMHSFEFEVT